jgi:hypothetical protein
LLVINGLIVGQKSFDLAPFINKELRKAVYKKRQLHNKYNKCKTKSNWENYRQQRNLVTRSSVNFSWSKFLKLLKHFNSFLFDGRLPFICIDIMLCTSLIPQL